MSLVDQAKSEFDRALEHFRGELAALRTGRANPAMLDKVLVESYGTKTPLKHLANITISDAKSLAVEPWDKNLLKEVEKGIAAANLGLSAAIVGQSIRVSVPSMTEESRKELVKVLKQKAEAARIAMRGLRDKLRETIGQQEKGGEITEDDRFRLQKDLDEMSSEYNEKIKELADNKEKEIMTV